MDVEDFAEEYALKADEELLLLAAASKDLTEEARTALTDELAKRGIRPVAPPPITTAMQEPIRIVVSVASGTPRPEASLPWQVLWFFLHLLILYALVMFFSWRLSSLAYSLVRFLFQQGMSPLDFHIRYLLLFSVIPGFLAGLIIARFNAKAGRYVWIVPAAILIVKIATFPVGHASVLLPQADSHWLARFQYYFAADLTDVQREFAQIWSTAPFYAAAAYSGAALVAVRSRLHEAIDNARQKPQGFLP